MLLLCHFFQKERWVVSPFLLPLREAWPSFFSPFNKTKYIDQVIHFNGTCCTKRGTFVLENKRVWSELWLLYLLLQPAAATVGAHSSLAKGCDLRG